MYNKQSTLLLSEVANFCLIFLLLVIYLKSAAEEHFMSLTGGIIEPHCGLLCPLDMFAITN